MTEALPIPFRWESTTSESLAGRFSVELAQKSGELHVAATIHSPPPATNSANPPIRLPFEADLWQDDVFELFIAPIPDPTRKPDQYAEFNFSPVGQWWAARFDGVREQAEELPNACTEFQVSPSAVDWTMRATIDLFDLGSELPVAVDQLALNATAIIGQHPRRYASWQPIDTEKPDFHQPRWFRPIPQA